jgi:glycosyltransferase involved in cell wall biosynthesis
LVVEVRDLWPAIFVELGVLTNRQLIWLLERLELWAYRVADAVVVVSEGFRDDLIRRGVDADKVHTVRNGVDVTRFQPGGNPAPGRERLGVSAGDVLVLYIGAHGISQGVVGIAEAAALLPHQPVHVAFVGEGAAKGALERRVAELRLDNVSLHPGVPRDDVASLLAAADICLVALRDIPLFSAFIPSKIFEYFGTGKAVIGAVRGEPAEILRSGGAMLVEPGDPQGLADAIEELAADPTRRAEMGIEARRYVELHFDRRELATQYRAILKGVLRQRAEGR